MFSRIFFIWETFLLFYSFEIFSPLMCPSKHVWTDVWHVENCCSMKVRLKVEGRCLTFCEQPYFQPKHVWLVGCSIHPHRQHTANMLHAHGTCSIVAVAPVFHLQRPLLLLQLLHASCRPAIALPSCCEWPTFYTSGLKVPPPPHTHTHTEKHMNTFPPLTHPGRHIK